MMWNVQDDMAMGHWMGTEHFTGYYLMFLNEVTNTAQQANWWQFNATTQVQQNELRSNNIDVFYAKRVITHYLTTRGVDQTRVYFMGDGNGADMAYHVRNPFFPSPPLPWLSSSGRHRHRTVVAHFIQSSET